MLILPGASSFHISCTLRTIPSALGWCCDIHTVVMKPLKRTLKNITTYINAVENKEKYMQKTEN
jgi:hypothetical protein